MTDYNLTISVNHEGIPPLLDVVQGDSGRNLVITVADMDITGYTARVYVVKPSGLDVYNNATVADGEIAVELTSQMLAEIGATKMQVSVYGVNDERVTTFTIWLNVQESLQDNGQINSSPEYKTLDELIDNANTAIEDTTAATDEANKAAESANSAASSANGAASSATAAASNANTAADEANTATTAANNAAQSASDAAQAANEAASAITYPVPITGGGTGGTTPKVARENLLLPSFRTYEIPSSNTDLSAVHTVLAQWGTLDSGSNFIIEIDRTRVSRGGISIAVGYKQDEDNGSFLFYNYGSPIQKYNIVNGAWSNNTVLEYTPSSPTYYVDVTNGNDTNNGLSADTAFQTIQRAIDVLPQYIAPNTTIQIAAGYYNENVVMRNKSGVNLTIKGANSLTDAVNYGVNSLSFVNSNLSIDVMGITATNVATNGGGFESIGCGIVSYTNCCAVNAGVNGFYLSKGKFRIVTSFVSDRTVAIKAITNADGYVQSIAGNNNAQGVQSQYGSTIYLATAIADNFANTATYKANGGLIVNTDGTLL